jgi:hypothetical protein
MGKAENHSQKKKRKKETFPLASIFLFISRLLGWFHLISSGKICFSYQDHICFGVFSSVHSNNKIVISSASDDVSQMCGILEVSFIFLRNVSEEEEKHSRENDNKGSRSY